ncbi:MAG: Nif3-like dinuclear metal center hexameric protein [Culicoidibacterales bacterium]
MSVKLGDLIRELEIRIPLYLSDKADNNGLKIGSLDTEIEVIMGTLELTREVLNFAIEKKVDAIFVHHDPIYFPLKVLNFDDAHTSLLVELIKNNIALYVAHTNMDAADRGLNEYMYQKLGGLDSQILDETSKIGRYGFLGEEVPLNKYIRKVILPYTDEIKVISNNENHIIRKIAVVSGSGGDFYRQAVMQKVDLFITGDIGYHLAMQAKEDNLAIIDIGHNFEKIVEEVWDRIFSEIKQEAKLDLIIETADFSFTPWKTMGKLL